MKYAKHSWTKEEIRALIKMWDTMTLDELALELGVGKQRIQAIAHVIRKKGYALAKKKMKGTIGLLIDEVLGEFGTAKSKK